MQNITIEPGTKVKLESTEAVILHVDGMYLKLDGNNGAQTIEDFNAFVAGKTIINLGSLQTTDGSNYFLISPNFKIE